MSLVESNQWLYRPKRGLVAYGGKGLPSRPAGGSTLRVNIASLRCLSLEVASLLLACMFQCIDVFLALGVVGDDPNEVHGQTFFSPYTVHLFRSPSGPAFVLNAKGVWKHCASTHRGRSKVETGGLNSLQNHPLGQVASRAEVRSTLKSPIETFVFCVEVVSDVENQGVLLPTVDLGSITEHRARLTPRVGGPTQASWPIFQVSPLNS